MFDKFPYTNFHELNLDWILSTIKNIAEEWKEVKGTVEGLREYIDDYFSKLDFGTIVGNEIKALADSGQLDSIIDGALEELVPLYFNPYKDEIDAEISGQNTAISKNSVDIAALKNQVESAAALPEGSTTLDAELVNIRTGENGIVYPSAGAAVRGNDANIKILAKSAFNQKSVEGAPVDYFYSGLVKSDIPGGSALKSYLYDVHAFSCVEFTADSPATASTPNIYTLFDASGSVADFKIATNTQSAENLILPAGATLLITSSSAPTVTGYTNSVTGGGAGTTVEQDFTDASLWALGAISDSGAEESSTTVIRTGFLESNITKLVASTGYLVRLYQYDDSGTFESAGDWTSSITFPVGKKYRACAKRQDGGAISVSGETTTTETATTAGVTWEQGGFATSSAGAEVDNEKRCRTSDYIPDDFTRVVFSGNITAVLYGWNNSTYVGASIGESALGTGSSIQWNSEYNFDTVKANNNVNRIKIMVRTGDGTSAITPSNLSGKFTFYKMSTTTTEGASDFLTFTRQTVSGGRIVFEVEVTKSPYIYDGVQTSVTKTYQNAIISLPTDYNHMRSEAYPIIMICHGTSGYVGANGDWYPGNADFDTMVQRFNAEGYIVFDVNNCANNSAGRADWGAPQVVEAYLKAFEYIRARYNVQDRILVYAISAGCFAGYNFILQNPGLVKAAVFGGVRASYEWVWSSTTNRALLQNYFGVSGTTFPAEIFAQWDIYQMATNDYYPLRFVPCKWIFADPSLDNYAVAQSKAVVEYIRKSGNISLSETITGADHHAICDLVDESLKKDVLAFYSRFA